MDISNDKSAVTEGSSSYFGKTKNKIDSLLTKFPDIAYVKIFLFIRIAFVIFGLMGMIVLQLKKENFGLAGIDIPLLWIAWCIIVIWTVFIVIIAIFSSYKSKHLLIEAFVAISLFVDGVVIYLASKGSIAVESPFFHTSYFLIAFHSFAFPAYFPNLIDKLGKIAYLMGGGAASIVVSMSIYCVLENVKFSSLTVYTVLSLQVFTAFSLSFLKTNEKKRVKQLTVITNDLERIQSNKDRLSRSLQSVASIAEVHTKEKFDEYLNTMCRDIGQTVRTEYCSIGLCEGNFLKDAATWTAFELTEEKKTNLSKHKTGNLEDTLVGAVLKKRIKIFDWNEDSDGDIADPDNKELKNRGLKVREGSVIAYRDEILSSKQLKHILVISLFSQSKKKPVGYIQIVNRLDEHNQVHNQEFTRADKEILNTLAPQLALALENFQIHQNEKALREEETFLNSLPRENELDVVFQKILSYLNTLMKSKVASIWMPIQDGFDKRDKEIKLVLRSILVGPLEKQTKVDKELQKTLERYNVSKIDECYVGRFFQKINRKNNIIFESDVTKKTNNWNELAEDIGTKNLIGIPIHRYIESKQSDEERSVFEDVLGILCLRPSDNNFEFTKSTEDQLLRFSKHISNLIEHVIYKRRYQQIDILQDGLEELHTTDLNLFYHKLVGLVKKAMQAEACSLFMINEHTNYLLLKATTAQNASTVEGKDIELDRNTKDLIGKDIYPLDKASITGDIFNQNSTTLIYDVLKHEGICKNFMEKTETGDHKSLIGVPIVKSNGEKIGVLRCINKKSKGTVLPVFTGGDMVFIGLITGIIARFIENAEISAEKAKFQTRLSHEFSTPLHAMKPQVDYIEKMYFGKIKVKNPLAQFKYLRDQITYLDYLNRDIDLRFGRDSNLKSTYMWGKVDIYSLITKVEDLLKYEARQDKGIDINYTESASNNVPYMYIDKMKFEQVIFNLVQNAIKYSWKNYHNVMLNYKGPVNKRFVNNSNHIWHEIEIKNWGVGILPAEKDVIFLEYKRGSNLDTVAVSGTGIGLAVAREIAENHEGYLEVTSLNEPTVFSIFLPDYLTKRSPKQ